MSTENPQPLSQRVRSLSKSGEWEGLNRLAETLEDVIGLNRGNPDLPTAPHIVDAGCQALKDGKTKYTHWWGIVELRRALSQKLRRDNDLHYDPDEIVVTSGSQEALFLAVMALTDPGDEVLVPDPYYMTFGRAIEAVGARVVPVRTSEREGFVPRPDEVLRAVTARSRVLVVSSPHNPTGVVLPEETLRGLARAAQQANLFVISDEIYEKLLYDRARHVSTGSLPGMRERTIVVNGFSKAYSMTGLRVGYLAAPRSVIAAMEILKGDLTICTASVSQWAALAAIEGPQNDVEDKVRIYDERRKIILQALDEAQISYARPTGAMYVFANISATGLSSREFCEQLLRDARVLVSSGTAFGSGEGYVRIAWLAPTEKVRRGMERFQEFVKRRRHAAAR